MADMAEQYEALRVALLPLRDYADEQGWLGTYELDTADMVRRAVRALRAADERAANIAETRTEYGVRWLSGRVTGPYAKRMAETVLRLAADRFVQVVQVTREVMTTRWDDES